MSNEWPSGQNPGPDVPPPPPAGPAAGQPGAPSSPYAPPPGYGPPPQGQPSYGPPGYAYAPGTYPPPSAPATSATNGFAVAALVLSLLGFVTGVTAIVGIILGFVALSQIKRTGQAGRGLAITGIVIGFAILVITVIGIVIAIALGAWFFTNAPQAVDKMSVVADLASASSAQETYRSEHGTYADSEAALQTSGFDPMTGIDLRVVRAGESSFCMEATRSTETYFVTQDREPRQGSCPLG